LKAEAFAMIPGGNQLVKVEHGIWPPEISMAYNIFRNGEGRIVKIMESPYSESGDWNIVNTSYFDADGQLFALERYLASFVVEGCGETVIKVTSVDYYDHGRRLATQSRTTDQNDREITNGTCTTPVKNDRFTFETDLQKYLEKIGYNSYI
jgi:hypothetical protein